MIYVMMEDIEHFMLDCRELERKREQDIMEKGRIEEKEE